MVVNGRYVTDNEVENFRNYVSGAIGLDDREFEKRNINFVIRLARRGHGLHSTHGRS